MIKIGGAGIWGKAGLRVYGPGMVGFKIKSHWPKRIWPAIAAMAKEASIMTRPSRLCQILFQAWVILLESPPALMKSKPAKIKLKKAYRPAAIKIRKIIFLKKALRPSKVGS